MSDKKSHRFDTITDLIFEYITQHNEGVDSEAIFSQFDKLLDSDVQAPRKAIGVRLGSLTKGGLIYRDEITQCWFAKNATPKGIDPAIPSYLRSWEGSTVTIYHQVEMLGDVVDIEFSIDGITYYPCAFSGDSNVSIARDIPEWGSDMRIYKNIQAVRYSYRMGGALKTKVENCQGMGLCLCIVSK